MEPGSVWSVRYQTFEYSYGFNTAVRKGQEMNVLSLFDGCGIACMALKDANISVEHYYASEIDKWAIQIALKNHPEIIQLGDVKTIDLESLPPIDLLIGGSPCQDLSGAGKAEGLFGDRSILFFEYARALRLLKPRYFLFENVASMKKMWRDIISLELGVEPVRINSSLVSGQMRDRLYWTNIRFEQPADRKIYWNDIYEFNAQCFYYTENSFKWLFATQKRKDKYKEYCSDELVKMQMVEASHYKGYSNQRCFGIKDVKGIRYVSPVECERLQTLPDNYTEGVSNTQRYKMLGNGFTCAVIEHIVGHIK
jgi:site-specific DNA-cytosine methylase